MTVTAVLRKRKNDSSVNIIYRHQNKSHQFFTGVKIEPVYWSVKGKVDFARSIKRNKTNEETIKDLQKKSDSFNVLINQKKVEIMDTAHRLQLDNKEPTIDAVLSQLTKKQTPTSTKSILKLIDQYLEDKSRLSYNTNKKRKHSLEKFKTFVTKNKLHITPESFDSLLYDRYKNYLVKSGLNTNSVASIIKILKSFLYYATAGGYPINPAFKEYDVEEEKPTIVYLEQSELKKLINHKFKEKHLARTRDLFILQCNTGLRISDLSRLGSQHIHDNIITMKAFKNKEPLFIPITPDADMILKKYDNNLPMIAQQVYNRQLKTMAEEAELNREIESVDYRDGKKIYSTIKIHKMISSHMAPKTFITHGIEKGITPKIMAKITGKSIEVLLKHYYGTDEEQIIKEMKKAFGAPMELMKAN